MILPKDAFEPMAAYLVDTNHLSLMVTEQHPLRQHIIRRIRLGDEFSIAAPTLTEMLYGIQMIRHASRNVAEWVRLSVMFGFHGIDQQAACSAAVLQIELRRRGWQLSTVDAFIATVALRHELTLLTTDKDFRGIPGLQVENWLAGPTQQDG
jgi:tRNA(fMet)-specific endonuclease VapC